MDKNRIKRIILDPLFLAFLFPFIGILMVMLFSQYCPFGKYSMLYSDMYHQYYPFFVSFRNAIRSGNSLLYTWDVGMGLDFWGLIAYYLASPLNLISVIIPERFLLAYFSFLVPIKLGLAGLFFAIFLKKLFHQNNYAISVFGALYGTCAWALAYQWNVMWLDTFALLPIVALGTIFLIRDKKVILYTATLFLSIASNYYIGFFTCIFVALIFFCYELCKCNRAINFFRDLGRIAFFSIIAIAGTLFLTLPTLSALQTTQSSVNAFPKGFVLNIATTNDISGLLKAMAQVAGNMGGSLEPSFKEGLPNVYTGVITLFLAVIYLFQRKISIRERICCCLLLVFFILSFIIRQLDYIWHGFHFTNMIPYRFSFLYSFVMLFMAYRAWMLREHISPVSIVVAGFVTLAVFSLSEHRFDTAFLAFNSGFTVIYSSLFLFRQAPKPKKSDYQVILGEDVPESTILDEEKYAAAYSVYTERRHIGTQFLMILVTAEVILNIISFGLWFPGTYVDNYPLGKNDTKSIIRYMKQREADEPFYRAETTHSQTLNDGALNGYYGISTFTSSANVSVTEYMEALGFGAKNTYNRYCYEESSPVSNLFLGIKYMIARDGKVENSDLWNDLVYFGNVHLLQNETYLPLGFLAEKELSDLDFSNHQNKFQFQNSLFEAATGIEEPVFRIQAGSCVTAFGDGVSVTFDSHTGRASYQNAAANSTIVYQFTANYDGFFCLNLDCPKRNNFSVWFNGEQLYTENLSLPQMISVCDVQRGDIIEVKLSCEAGESSTMTVKSAILDKAVYRKGYDKLKASVLDIHSFKTTKISGDILCDRDGLLYTSIPQNGNWKVFVDGKEVSPLLVGNAMISVPLNKGLHDISFVYQNDAFRLGCIGSLVSLIIFALSLPLYYKQKGKYLG